MQQCQHKGCLAEGTHPIYHNGTASPDGWLCDVHVTQQGYCSACGRFVANDDRHRTTWAFFGLCRTCWQQRMQTSPSPQ